jgi:hypothetical protein
MPTWPASLPQFVLTRNYKESPPDLVIRTKMDAGPAKVRRRFTAGVRPIEAMLVLNGDQLAVLDDFYLTACQGGALSFTWTYQREWQDTDMTPDTDTLIDTDILQPAWQTATMRFVKPPVYADVGDGQNYECTLNLEIMP